MSQTSLMTKFQQAELSRLMFLGAKTTDQITHSDWSNFVTHTACVSAILLPFCEVMFMAPVLGFLNIYFSTFIVLMFVDAF